MHANQHKQLFLVALCLIIAMILAAAVSAAAQLPECVPGNLSDYQRLGLHGCVIGDQHFSSFTYQRTPNGPPAAAVLVTPGTVADNDDPALLFEARWVASLAGSSIDYRVETTQPGKWVSGASLEMQFGQVTGTGEVKLAAELHPSTDSLSACGPAQLTLKVSLNINQGNNTMDSGKLKYPARQLCVVTPLSIVPGRNGTASLKSFMTVFHSSAMNASSADNHSERWSMEVGQR